MEQGFPIIHDDESMIVIHKPPGILVHRSEATSRREPAVLQIMRNLTGQRLYPVHRLDRPTSGVLVLARSPEFASILGRQWMEQLCHKTYLAIVRGFAPETGVIDHALSDLDQPEDPAQDARTRLKRLATVELDYPVDRYPKARYSLVELQPDTGRRHQLRRHMKSIFHPIIGDSVYGHGVHNRFFRDHFKVPRLLLHHLRLQLTHPVSGQPLTLEAPLDEEWRTLTAQLGWAAVT